MAFDENVNSSLGRITADIETRKQLSYIYRFLYPALSGAGAIAINRETMPSLYAYIESVFIKQHMAVPYIFIPRDVLKFRSSCLYLSDAAKYKKEKLLK